MTDQTMRPAEPKPPDPSAPATPMEPASAHVTTSRSRPFLRYFALAIILSLAAGFVGGNMASQNVGASFAAIYVIAEVAVMVGAIVAVTAILLLLLSRVITTEWPVFKPVIGALLGALANGATAMRLGEWQPGKPGVEVIISFALAGGVFGFIAGVLARALLGSANGKADSSRLARRVTPGQANGILGIVAGSLAFGVISGARMLLVLPSGFYDTPGDPAAVAVSGDYAYIADQDTGLRIINISDPAHPFGVGSFVPPGPHYALNGDIVTGNLAIITKADRIGAENAQNGLRLVDVSQPAAPRLLGSYDLPVPADYEELDSKPHGLRSVLEPVDLAVAGHYAYLAANGNGLVIIDISNPALPTRVGAYIPPDSWISSVVLKGNYAYVEGGWADKILYIVDISQPTRPIQVGSYSHGRLPDVIHGCCFLAVADNYVYYDGYIIDVTNPAAPTEAGAFAPKQPCVVNDMQFSGHHAFVACSSSLSIYDMLGPTHLVEAGLYDTPHDVQRIAVAGGYAYLAEAEYSMFHDYPNGVNQQTGVGGLRIVDISDPAHPVTPGE
jgi:hypothetical protein